MDKVTKNVINLSSLTLGLFLVYMFFIPRKCRFPLLKGAKNCKKVKRLQNALNIARYDCFATQNRVNWYPLKENGDFDEKTELAVIDFFGYADVTEDDLLTLEDSINNDIC
jgi:hypothetical protein